MKRKYSVKSQFRGKKFIAVRDISGGKIEQEEVVIPHRVEDHEAIRLVQKGITPLIFESKKGAEPLENYVKEQKEFLKQKDYKRLELKIIKQGAIAPVVKDFANVKISLYETFGVDEGKKIFDMDQAALKGVEQIHKVAALFGVKTQKSVTDAYVKLIYDAIH